MKIVLITVSFSLLSLIIWILIGAVTLEDKAFERGVDAMKAEMTEAVSKGFDTGYEEGILSLSKSLEDKYLDGYRSAVIDFADVIEEAKSYDITEFKQFYKEFSEMSNGAKKLR